MRQFGERKGKRRGKKAMSLLVLLPAPEGWKPRASPAIGAKGRKVFARTRGRLTQQ